ncbi:MAG TPA: DUF6364 family protein [Thermoanaerobaculia bacterium]|nr:DUF6364 family protein [Thermoanaerobaculia bacterium]
MNHDLTLSLDERLVEEAQKVASAMGKSLNQLIRDYLEVRRDKPMRWSG